MDYTGNTANSPCAPCTNNATQNCKCSLNFTLSTKFEGPVYMYYGLSNFYQNFRRYGVSRDDNQLFGVSSSMLVCVNNCAPFDRDAYGTPIAPCGAIANSFFNDTFVLFHNDTGRNIPLDGNGIAWWTDYNIKFRNPGQINGNLTQAFQGTVKPLNWPKPAYDLDTNLSNNGFLNQDFLVWMRTAALPDFRKLYRRISDTDYASGLPAGNYSLEISYKKGTNVQVRACGKFFQLNQGPGFYFGKLPLSLAVPDGQPIIRRMYDEILITAAKLHPKIKLEDITNDKGLMPLKLAASTRKIGLFQHTVKHEMEERQCRHLSRRFMEWVYGPVHSSFFSSVLQLDPEITDDEIKKRFRQLSILVHPDKNQDDPERAQKAFEAVDKAYKLLLDSEQKKRAVDVIHAGKEYVEHTMKEKKKQLKKEGKPTVVEEDDPELFRQAVYKQTMKLFAELEIKRKEREAKDMHERKRQREEEIEAQEKAKREREWQKNFEETRDGRVDSWRTFQAKGKTKKEKKNRSFLKPPKVKMEQR
ncbi:DNJC8 protein, partial [Amia calva]|nr:DNJC8 protein [Amia calva]